MNAQVIALENFVKLRQNQFANNFFHEDVSQDNSFENSNDYQSKHDGISYNQWNPNTGERRFCLYYLNLSMLFRDWSSTPASYKMEICVTIVIASSRWLLSQRALSIAVGILDPTTPKTRRVEQVDWEMQVLHQTQRNSNI